MTKKLTFILILNTICLTTLGQKIDWDKPLYEIKVTSIFTDGAPYKFLDTIATYIYYDDTTTIIMRETNKIVINSYGKLPNQWFQNRHIAYYMPLHLQYYDKTGNITTKIILRKQTDGTIKADTIAKYNNTYDSKTG